MTLDQAIQHCLEKAEEQSIIARNTSYSDTYIADCLECASEHQQLAEWLTELQERREADRWIPISEPPKEHDYYLVTCEFGVARATDIALFYPDRKGEEQWSLNYVTAWKPLPEPYESEDK